MDTIAILIPVIKEAATLSKLMIELEKTAACFQNHIVKYPDFKNTNKLLSTNFDQ
ncbi:hypothetical protein N9805_04800 [Paracoccaceae bacterium]|nr:hypothetical protein [Paracoccaceae bacterium]